MKFRMALLVLQIVMFPFLIHGQNSGNPLTPKQQLGRRIFQQRCAVCHTRPMLTSKRPWGPVLSKDLIEGKEDSVRETILKGKRGLLMPGFQYGLNTTEVDAIIEYLKTGPELVETGNKAESNSEKTKAAQP